MSGETAAEAVARELEEELCVRAVAVLPAVFESRDEGSSFVISFYPVEIQGDPAAMEHAAIAWVARGDLVDLPLAPSDARFVKAVLAPG